MKLSNLMSALQLFYLYLILNLFFTTLGIQFIKVFYHHELSNKKNKKILMIIWIFHILIPVCVMAINLMTIKMIQISTVLYTFLTSLFTVFGFIHIWTVSFLTWTISFYIYEYLLDIKQSLILEFQQNSGFH
jgi:hypothetical protein